MSLSLCRDHSAHAPPGVLQDLLSEFADATLGAFVGDFDYPIIYAQGADARAQVYGIATAKGSLSIRIAVRDCAVAELKCQEVPPEFLEEVGMVTTQLVFTTGPIATHSH